MTRFLDGPVAGCQLFLTRFPLFLRVAKNGESVDALDMLDDEPAEGEVLLAYRRQGKPTSIHIDYIDKKTRKRASKWLGAADYRMVASQPPADVMADSLKWREWCVAERAREVVA